MGAASLVALLGPPAIKGIIALVEKLHGPGGGQDKRKAVVSAIAGTLSQAVAQGKIQDVKADTIGELIDTFVALMNSQGELPKPVPNQAAQTPGRVTLAVVDGQLAVV